MPHEVIDCGIDTSLEVLQHELGICFSIRAHLVIRSWRVRSRWVGSWWLWFISANTSWDKVFDDLKVDFIVGELELDIISPVREAFAPTGEHRLLHGLAHPWPVTIDVFSK